MSMHPVRPLKNNNENDRRSERYEEMSKEVVVDGMDTKVSQIPEEDVAEEAEDQAPTIPDEDVAEDVKAQAPLVARAPSKPSQTEVDLHEVSHYPYRLWCEHCVRGRGKDDCHKTVTGVFAESSMTRVSMDYTFLTEDETYKETEHIKKVSAQVSMTVLVMTETQCGNL